MARHWDGPATGRIGFGFKQAQDAGVPFIAPRSGKQMSHDLREREAAIKLHSLIEENDNFGPQVAKMIRKGMSAQDILRKLSPSSL